jgi:hypothetical protein
MLSVCLNQTPGSNDSVPALLTRMMNSWGPISGPNPLHWEGVTDVQAGREISPSRGPIRRPVTWPDLTHWACAQRFWNRRLGSKIEVSVLSWLQERLMVSVQRRCPCRKHLEQSIIVSACGKETLTDLLHCGKCLCSFAANFRVLAIVIWCPERVSANALSRAMLFFKRMTLHIAH